MGVADLSPGDHYVKQGIEVTIHFVARGQVFGVVYRVSAIRPGHDAHGWPHGFLRTFRMPLEAFAAQIVGADAVRDHELGGGGI